MNPEEITPERFSNDKEIQQLKKQCEIYQLLKDIFSDQRLN